MTPETPSYPVDSEDEAQAAPQGEPYGPYGPIESSTPYGPYGPYAPTAPTPTQPANPEAQTGHEQRLLAFLNEQARRDEERAQSRYGGLFGRMRRWVDREGQRTQNAQTLEEAGQFVENSRWKRWGRIALKVGGGVGVSAAMVMTGGIGTFLTPMLWTMGVREAWDGVLMAGEQLGWGNRRRTAELAVQQQLSEQINRIKEQVRTGGLTEEEFITELNTLLDEEREVFARQGEHLQQEQRGRKIRSVVSSLLTLGTGAFVGVPLGAQDYDGLHKIGWGAHTATMDQYHNTFFNWHGGHFTYGPGEFERLKPVVDAIKQRCGEQAINLTRDYHLYFGALQSHVMNLPPEAMKPLLAAGGYLLGRAIQPFLSRPRLRPPVPDNFRLEPYGPYGPYGPEGGYTPYGLTEQRTGRPLPTDADQPRTAEDYERILERDQIQPAPYRRLRLPGQPEQWVNQENQPVSRDVERERQTIKTYLDSQGGAYRTQLEGYVKELPAMPERCRVAITMPAYQEEKAIFHTLREYVKQTDEHGVPLDPDLFEINIIVNRPETVTADKTAAEIKRFKEQYPRYHINVIDVVFTKDEASVGRARKYIADLSLLRSLNRPSQSGALYIESEDVDLIKVDPRTVTNLIAKLDKNPHLDAVRGTQDRNPDILKQNDYAFLDRRLWDFTELMLRSKKFRPEQNPNWDFMWHRVVTGGWNTGFSAEAYALIHGYNPRLIKGEDMDIGMKISMVRGEHINEHIKPNLETVSTVGSRSQSSPRRYLEAIAREASAYTDFGDTKLEQKIRSMSDNELLLAIKDVERVNSQNRDRFEALINNTYHFFKNRSPNRAEADQMMRDIMLWLGFDASDYAIINHEVKVHDFKNFAIALESYRQLGPLKMDLFKSALAARKMSIQQFLKLAPERQRELVESIKNPSSKTNKKKTARAGDARAVGGLQMVGP